MTTAYGSGLKEDPRNRDPQPGSLSEEAPDRRPRSRRSAEAQPWIRRVCSSVWVTGRKAQVVL